MLKVRSEECWRGAQVIKRREFESLRTSLLSHYRYPLTV